MVSHYDKLFLDSGKPIFQTITQTAKITGQSEYELRKMKEKGLLPCIITGNSKILIHVPMLLDYLECKVFANE